jgi:hypothetical protein
MNRIKTVFGLSTALLAGVVANAGAQETKPINLSLRAGFFFPSNAEARDEGKTWLALGAEFKLKDLHFGEYQPGYSAALTLSIDHYGKGDFYNTPVMLNYVGRVNQFYYTGGAGFGWTEVPGVPDAKTNSLFSYSLGIGYDFQHGSLPVFIEAKYWGSTETKLNGLGVYIGVRL